MLFESVFEINFIEPKTQEKGFKLYNKNSFCNLTQNHTAEISTDFHETFSHR